MLGMLGLLAVVVVGCGALIAVASQSATDSETETSFGDSQPREELADLPDDVEESTADTEESTQDNNAESASDNQTEEEPEPAGGTRDNPFAIGTLTSVTWDTLGDADNSVWNTTVGEVRDITDEVLATNEFNDPPPDGVVFAGVDVEMTLVGAEKVPLSQGFNFSWEIFGGDTNAVYDSTTIETESFGCGVSPNELDSFDEVFIGGTIAGTICIPLPVSDLTDPETFVSMTLGDGVFFGPNGLSPAAQVTPQAEDPFEFTERTGARQSPFAFDAETPIEFQTIGDADGSVWTATISAPSDITALVASENQFNDPPADGAIFAGFEVSMTLVSSDVEPLSPAFNLDFEITGGATAAVYGELTLSGEGLGCGVVGGEFDEFNEVVAGGTLTGTVCVPIPVEDLAHPNTRVAINFLEDSRVYFG